MSLRDLLEAQRAAKLAAAGVVPAASVKPAMPEAKVVLSPSSPLSGSGIVAEPSKPLSALERMRQNRPPPAEKLDRASVAISAPIIRSIVPPITLNEQPQVAPVTSRSSLDDLNKLVMGKEERPEIAATFETGLAELRKNLDFLSANMEQKDLVGQVVRTIMIQLTKNPTFSSKMSDTDYDTLTRGFRRAHNVAKRKAEEKKTVKAGKKREVNEFADFMKDSGMGSMM